MYRHQGPVKASLLDKMSRTFCQVNLTPSHSYTYNTPNPSLHSCNIFTHSCNTHIIIRTRHLITYHCTGAKHRPSKHRFLTKCSRWCKLTRTTHGISDANCARNASSCASTASVVSRSPTTWWYTRGHIRVRSCPSVARYAGRPSRGRTICASTGQWMHRFWFLLCENIWIHLHAS